MAKKFCGIITPNMVPLDERGEIHEDEYRRYIDWLIERGVHGIFPNGSTGEFTRFTSEERRRIVRITCEQVAGRVPVLAGAAEENIRESIRACETYKEYGADAVAIVSPYYYKLSQPAIFAYFREIAAHSPIDVTLYNIPLFSNPMELDTIRRLAELERVIGIKDSSGDISFMLRMIGAIRPDRPQFTFITGWDAACLPMILVGCDGGIHAFSGVAPEVTRRLYELARDRKIDEALPLQLRLTRLFDQMVYGADFPNGFRPAVELRGFDFGPGRQPIGEGKPIDINPLKEQMRDLLQAVGAVL